jgi:hypothetical protein
MVNSSYTILHKKGILNWALFFFVHLVFMQTCYSMDTTKKCHPLLWPTESAVIDPLFSISQTTISNLQQCSEKLIREPIHPISFLSSSGKTNIKDALLIVSRNSLKDASNVAVLALTYRLTQNIEYFNKVREILIKWSKINNPTGNPIDETKLEGMIWAYDLISCDLSYQDNQLILNWFERIRIKKIAWKFSKITDINNHHVHQIKMLLMLDKILHRDKDLKRDIATAEKYSKINLNAKSGISIDYLQRTALYYHNYVMQPWLEICLISDYCWHPVRQAFSFLKIKILSHNIGNEFFHSQAKIDSRREKGGFLYAVRGGVFDVSQAAPTIISYYTVAREYPEPELWHIQKQAKKSPWLTFLRARRVLWKP